MTEFTEDMAIALGKWLFDNGPDESNVPMELLGWLSGPRGLECVETAMITRGYEWEASCDHLHDGANGVLNFYWTWKKGCLGHGAWAATKGDAILLAAHKAMEAEHG